MLLQRHLSLVLVASLAIGPIAPASGIENQEVRVVVDNANVRSEPSAQSRVLEQAPRGTVLRVIEEMGDWYLVTAPGMQPGYVAKTVVESLTVEPAAKPTPAPVAAPMATTPRATVTPTITHDPLACMAADDNPLLLADVTAQAQVHKTRVYFKAHQFPDWYYVDMKVPSQPHYLALLPQPLPETKTVDYYIHALDTTLETARTDQYEPTVSKTGCVRDEGAAAARVDPREATQIVIGGTKAGQPPIPPGFSKKGILAFVAVTGAVITGAALLTATATTATTATAAATTATAATAGTAGAAGAGTATATATASTAAAAGGGGMSGGAIAGIVGGGVLVVGGVAYGGYKLLNKADELACPSASEIVAQSAGAVVAEGNDTICTTSASCDHKSYRACVSNYCSTSGGCSLYIQFSDGVRVTCNFNCGNGDYSGIYSCANTAAARCN
jgi:hypothetical protein